MLENNIAIVVSCMPAFAVFMKQNILETNAFKSLRSALRSSGKGSGGSGGSASYPVKWAGIKFGGASDKPKAERNDHLPFDSYLDLEDQSRSRPCSVEQQIQQKGPQWSMSDLSVSQTTTAPPAYIGDSPPQDGILRTIQVEQDYSPLPAANMGRAQ